MITKYGREIYRHRSDKGSVLEWVENGFKHKTFILDAAYRPEPMRVCDDNSVFNREQLYDPYKNYYPLQRDGKPLFYLTDLSEDEKRDDCLMSMIEIIDQGTSEYNTVLADKANRYHDVENLATEVLNNDIIIDGKRCTVPNIQTLIVLTIEGEAIDQLDPTARQYGGVTSNGKFDQRFWSSTEYLNGYYNWCVDCPEVCYLGKSEDMSTIPVVEL